MSATSRPVPRVLMHRGSAVKVVTGHILISRHLAFGWEPVDVAEAAAAAETMSTDVDTLPTVRDTHDVIDAYAANHDIDLTGATSKAEKVDRIGVATLSRAALDSIEDSSPAPAGEGSQETTNTPHGEE